MKSLEALIHVMDSRGELRLLEEICERAKDRGELDEEAVNRLREIFGERFVVSPSHEALLPNVSLEKVRAMRDAAIAP